MVKPIPKIIKPRCKKFQKKVKQIEHFQNKMGLKDCKWSSLNAPGTQTPLSHSFLDLEISLFSLLALWGNKNWPPSIKMRDIKIFHNKMGLKGCKWPSLNAPGTQTPLSHSFLEFEISIFSLLALWGNKNWPPRIKMKQIENCQNKMSLKGCKSSSLNAPGTQTPLSHSDLKLRNSRHYNLDQIWHAIPVRSGSRVHALTRLSSAGSLVELTLNQCTKRS